MLLVSMSSLKESNKNVVFPPPFESKDKRKRFDPGKEDEASLQGGEYY